MRTGADITRAVETHSDTVLRVCTLYFPSRPEREDAFQETFLKYAQTEKDFAGAEHVKAWLIKVAANTCKDMLKSLESKAVLTDEFDESACPSWTDPQPGDDASSELLQALQLLDEKQRVALYLKYYEDYTAAQIGELLGIPENTVYTNLSRGRNKLKEVLTNERDARRPQTPQRRRAV